MKEVSSSRFQGLSLGGALMTSGSFTMMGAGSVESDFDDLPEYIKAFLNDPSSDKSRLDELLHGHFAMGSILAGGGAFKDSTLGDRLISEWAAR